VLATGLTASGCAQLAGLQAADPADPAALRGAGQATQTTGAARPVEAGAARAPSATPIMPGPRPGAAIVDAATSSPAPTPATASAAAAPAPVRHDNLWERIRAGFAFPELDTPLVADKERFYLRKPENLQRMFARGGPYLHYIVEEIEKRGMPTELALLPFVESAMNPVALSPAKAAGLWQFIPSTGRTFNLSQDWWVDNRRDVVESTQAALDYLQKIYAMQGNDWFLALASYNWGEGAVARAMQKNRARGRGTDYLSLDMPSETRHYVPKLIALKNILMQAPGNGLVLPMLPNKPYFVTIEKTRPIDLKLAAQFAGMSVDEFVALNPAHNRPVIAASRNNEIKLPADRIDAFLEAVERHGEANRAFVTWQPHTFQPGEALEALSRRVGIEPAELRRVNGLKATGRLLPGTRLLVPDERGVEDDSVVESFAGPRLYEQVDAPAGYHTVGRKDTAQSIARHYGISVDSLLAWNGLKKGVHPGMRLVVRPATAQTPAHRRERQPPVAVASTPKAMPAATPSVEPAKASTPPPAKSRGPAPAKAASASPAKPAAPRRRIGGPDRPSVRQSRARRAPRPSNAEMRPTLSAGRPRLAPLLSERPPGRRRRRRCLSPTRRARRSRVPGCTARAARRRASRVSPCSTMRPSFITSTRCAIARMTARSWVMKR
jgi:membrane-bound lytic murein transglycosylase D